MDGCHFVLRQPRAARSRGAAQLIELARTDRRKLNGFAARIRGLGVVVKVTE